MLINNSEIYPSPEQMMTIKDLQNALKCSKTFAYEIVRQPDFPKIKINSRYIIPVSAYNQWVKQYTCKSFAL
jgi:predicted DNA-binding transcriptional regulator AlpA